MLPSHKVLFPVSIVMTSKIKYFKAHHLTISDIQVQFEKLRNFRTCKKPQWHNVFISDSTKIPLHQKYFGVRRELNRIRENLATATMERYL